MTYPLLHTGRADATYNTAERAAAEYRDTRTKAQRRFDDLAASIADHVAHLRALTYPDAIGWARNAKALEAVSDRVLGLRREVQALMIEGFREGDPVGGIPKLEPIATKAAQLSAPEVT